MKKSDYYAKVEKVYYDESEFGGPHGGHCGYQWLCDIGIYYKTARVPVHVFKKCIPIKFKEPTTKEFKAECKYRLKQYIDEHPERIKIAQEQAREENTYARLNAVASKVKVTA